MTYDPTDRQLLGALRRNSRAKYQLYTRATGIPKSTVHDRVNRLVRGGVRCTALMDWEALGCPFGAFFILDFDEQILAHPAVNTCTRIAPNQMLLECLFSTALELEHFKLLCPGARCYPHIATLKREGFVPLAR